MAVAYAVWEGLGIVGIAATGHLVFGEHLTAGRLAALAAILVGIVLIEAGIGKGRDAAEDALLDDGRPV